MEKLLKQALLFDFYGELLTEHQKQVYEEVVLEDYSLSEVAEERGISRQGVHDLIKRCNKVLSDYEDKLHLVEKFIKIQKTVEEIDALATTKVEADDLKNASDEYSRIMEQIKALTDGILKEI
ncbi:MAG: DNA-binding protein [Lachnospiraceae bacterium]|nr:DNA-binding protein [Lachnospiraceae bacterium]